jgi:hypothetical protein
MGTQNKKVDLSGRAWWYITVILATQETETGRMEINGQHGHNAGENAISKNKPGVVE